MSAPHRIVDEIMDGVANGISGAVSTATGSMKQMGNQLMTGLDGPIRQLTGRNGPHRILDSALNGGVDAMNNAIVQGGIGSAKIAGEGIARALDNPVEELGIPPKDVGTIGPIMK